MMSSGIYAYWDNVKNYYVYVGKDSNIDKKTRHYKHIAESAYNEQPINRVLQNNPERYEYRVIMEGVYDDWELNQMEKLCIRSFKTYKYDYPEKNIFNFTKGGDGMSGYKHTKDTLKKISETHKGKEISKETRRKMSESHKGEKNHMWGKKHTPEACKKITDNHADFSGEKGPKYRHDVPSPQELLIEYNSGNITQKKMAEKYNCSLHLIETRLRKARKDGD